MQANFNFNLDVNKVGDPIALGPGSRARISGQGNADRAGFVKNLSNTCFYQEGQKYSALLLCCSLWMLCQVLAAAIVCQALASCQLYMHSFLADLPFHMHACLSIL